MIDSRKPALVTSAFHDRLARELEPLGFASRSKSFVRRKGDVTHRVELSSSHHNAPGYARVWLAVVVLDKRIARVEDAWRAGGGFGAPEFGGLGPPANVADPAEADALVTCLRDRLSFFDRLDDAPRLLVAFCKRYVPGMIDPRIIVPYLVVRIGVDAARTYARALLAGRPELWPAFVGAHRRKMKRDPKRTPDHGSELAIALAKHGVSFDDDPPKDAVVCTSLEAGNLRSFFGLQLRAWGEVEAAASLRRVPDARIKALRGEQERAFEEHGELAYVNVIRREVGSARRPPRRKAPSPRLFQYEARHGPFAQGAATGRSRKP